MSVYFVANDDLVKIGFSADVKRRTDAVCTQFGPKTEYLGFMPGDRTVERHLHQRFEHLHEWGEWFRQSDDLSDFIVTVARSGYPSEEPFSAADRLQAQEERYAEEAAFFIQTYTECTFKNLSDHERQDAFTLLANTLSIPVGRLRAIHEGAVCPVTAGEYVMLRMTAESLEIEGNDDD